MALVYLDDSTVLSGTTIKITFSAAVTTDASMTVAANWAVQMRPYRPPNNLNPSQGVDLVVSNVVLDASNTFVTLTVNEMSDQQVYYVFASNVTGLEISTIGTVHDDQHAFGAGVLLFESQAVDDEWLIDVPVYLGGEGGGSAATATMTGILDNNTIPAALDAQTITIIDAVGLSKTYKFMNGGGKSTGDTDGGAIVIQMSGEDTKEGLVDNIEQGIEHSNGHNGSITVTRNGAVITLVQAAAGVAGDTAIVFSAGINTSTELSKTDFTGGSASPVTMVLKDNPGAGAADTITIDRAGKTDAQVMALAKLALAGTADSDIIYATSGRGAQGVGVAGVKGLRYADPAITVVADVGGPIGNGVIAVTNVNGDVVNTTGLTNGKLDSGAENYAYDNDFEYVIVIGANTTKPTARIRGPYLTPDVVIYTKSVAENSWAAAESFTYVGPRISDRAYELDYTDALTINPWNGHEVRVVLPTRSSGTVVDIKAVLGSRESILKGQYTYS